MLYIYTEIDPDQSDSSPRDRIAYCPNCKQKLQAIESLHHRGLFRPKCRRCNLYIKVYAVNREDK